MWGIVPAAGLGTRIQPLAFSKELLPVGGRKDGQGGAPATERPKAVSEYLIDRMILGGATDICFVIAPGKADIVEYYGGFAGAVPACYVVQPKPSGLCDAIFRAKPIVKPREPVLIGLPDTVWFPDDGLLRLGDDPLSFLLFPVERPELFDAVVTDAEGRVIEVQVKQDAPSSTWVWGAFKLQGWAFNELYDLWRERDQTDQYFGTLVNAYIARGGRAVGVRAGQAYVDVGTLHGYREAIRLLSGTNGVEPHATICPANLPQGDKLPLRG